MPSTGRSGSRHATLIICLLTSDKDKINLCKGISG